MARDVELKSGLRVGNYVLAELIGRGAFGEVWKAAHFETPHRIRAVKIATDPAYRRQLAHEGSLPEIDHPNVVPILDSDTRVAEIPYLVMPYLGGGSLADQLKANPNGLPEDRVGTLLKDILAGLAAAHALGIVHRDIKPANILLDNEGRALVSDFGLSCSESVPDALRSVMQSTSLALDQGETLAGTLAYMAPEVLEGAAPTPAADMYSVGVLLFEMLVGRRPGGIETPRRARANLVHAVGWDRLYVKACCPLRLRFTDGKAMLAALEREEAAWNSPPASSADDRTDSETETGEPDVDVMAVERDTGSSAASVNEQLRAAVRMALADGQISWDESEELQRLAERVGATATQVKRIIAEIREEQARQEPSAVEREVVAALRDFLPNSRIHIGPGIPADKLHLVRMWCNIGGEDRVLAMIDCTHFRSAKDCVVFTEQGVCFRNSALMSPAAVPTRRFLTYEELATCPLWTGAEGNNLVYLGSQRAFNTNAFPKEKLRALLSALAARIQSLK